MAGAWRDHVPVARTLIPMDEQFHRSLTDIRSNFTQEVMRALFTELLETFPTVDGLVLRYGENSPCNYHEGNAPYDTSDAVPSLQVQRVPGICIDRRSQVCLASFVHAAPLKFPARRALRQARPRRDFSDMGYEHATFPCKVSQKQWSGTSCVAAPSRVHVVNEWANGSSPTLPAARPST